MNKSFSTIGIALFIALGSCERQPTEEIGGKGGNVTFKITSQHHGKNIDSCTVYIKYNSQDAATTYDDSAKVKNENGKPVATFSSLKKGKYYILGRGWDPTIADDVKGGIPQNIIEERTFEITLPVTEE